MSKIRNTGITGKWGFRHTYNVATAAQKDFRNYSLWTCSHIMAILRNKNKNTDFLDDFSLIVSLRFEAQTFALLNIGDFID